MASDTILAQLGTVPFFGGLSRRSLRALARLTLPRHYAAGSVIIEEGDVGLGLFVIVGGRVEIYKGRGEDRLLLATVERGNVLGEMALIDDQPRSATAVAVDEVDCLLVTRDAFQRLVRSDPDVAWHFVPVLVQRVRRLQHRLLALEEESVEEELSGVPSASDREVAGEDESGADRRAGGSVGGGAGDLLVRMLRAQHAALQATVTALGGAVELGGTFLGALAGETGLNENRTGRQVMRRLPRGLDQAVRDTLRQSERLPERVVSSFRRHWKRS